MGTLETLRNKAGVFVTVILGLALLAFVLGDLLGSGQSIFNRGEMEVGRVDGVAYDYTEYQAAVDRQLKMRQALSGQGQTEQMQSQIREMVWRTFLQKEVLGRECERLGLAVTDDELSNLVLGNDPMPVVKQVFTNPETQEFDRERMLNFLQNLDNVTPEQREYWYELERGIADEQLMQKYTNLVSKGLWVTTNQAEQLQKLQQNQADVAYIVTRYASEPDSLFSVTDTEAKAYYERHKESYRRDERRDIAYVTFTVRPQDEDRDVAMQAMQKDAVEFATTENPTVYVTQLGDEPYAGRWYAKEDLPTEIAEWAFSAQDGEVSPIVYDNEAFKMARLIRHRSLPDSANARHILFSADKYPGERAQQMADSVAELIRKGADFKALAEQYSDDPGSKSKGGDLDWFAQGRMVKPFNDACFEGKKGEIQVVASNFGVHIIEVLGQKGGTPRVDLAILVHNIVPGKHTYQQVFNEASSFASLVHTERPGWFASLSSAKEKAYADKMIKDFDSLANERTLMVQAGDDLEQIQTDIRGLENSREVVRWAFGAKPGDVSSVFELGDTFVVALLKDIKASDGVYADWTAVQKELIDAVLRDKKAAAIEAKLKDASAGASSMDAVASKVGEGVKRANAVNYDSYSFGSDGYEPALVGVASQLTKGQLVGPIRGNQGVYMVQAEEVTANANARPSDIKQSRDEFSRRASYEAYSALEQMSKVEDRRGKFF